MRFLKNRTAVGLLVLGSLLPLTFAANAAAATAPPMGDAASFGALSFSAMTNSGLDTVVNGNIGSSTSMDVGVTTPGWAPTALARADECPGQPPDRLRQRRGAVAHRGHHGQNLAGQRLGAGVYNSSGGIAINGPVPLTLDGGGNADAVFIFQAASAGNLTVTPTSSVSYVNGAQPCNVFWKVGSAFLQNTGFTFVGTIMALTQITLTDSITVQGRLLAQTADVTFIHDVVNLPVTCSGRATSMLRDAAAGGGRRCRSYSGGSSCRRSRGGQGRRGSAPRSRGGDHCKGGRGTGRAGTGQCSESCCGAGRGNESCSGTGCGTETDRRSCCSCKTGCRGRWLDQRQRPGSAAGQLHRLHGLVPDFISLGQGCARAHPCSFPSSRSVSWQAPGPRCPLRPRRRPRWLAPRSWRCSCTGRPR